MPPANFNIVSSTPGVFNYSIPVRDLFATSGLLNLIPSSTLDNALRGKFIGVFFFVYLLAIKKCREINSNLKIITYFQFQTPKFKNIIFKYF